MAGAPAAHVEPLDRPGGSWPILFVEEDQLLQCPDRCVLEHLLQLEGGAKRREPRLRQHSRWTPPTNLPWVNAYLSQGGLLVPQADDEDAVRLADAALGPRSHAVVSLVQDNSIDVLLLGQPARQTVLMYADGKQENSRNKDMTQCVTMRLVGEEQKTYECERRQTRTSAFCDGA